MDLIEDSLNFFLIVLDRAHHADGRVQSGSVGDFGSVEVIDTMTGRTVYQVVGGMLVGPGGVSTRAFDHFEDRVALDCVVGIDRDTGAVHQATGQVGGIDHIERHVRGVVHVDGFVKHHVVAGAARAGRVRGIEVGAVV